MAANDVEYQLLKAVGQQPYYWRVVATGNNQVLATSETYYNRADAVNAANLVRMNSSAQTGFYDYTDEKK